MKNSSSKQSGKMDMLHGSLLDKILLFAIPLAACSILQQLFNSVGTAVVGRFASSEALAAVGSNSSVISLMVTLFSGISLGSNVVIANYIGQCDKKRVPRVVHTAVTLALLSGVFLLVLGQFVAHPILVLMGAPKNIIHLATLYLRIYFLGMPFFMLYDFGASILRSIGDTRRPMYALIVSGGECYFELVICCNISYGCCWSWSCYGWCECGKCCADHLFSDARGASDPSFF